MYTVKLHNLPLNDVVFQEIYRYLNEKSPGMLISLQLLDVIKHSHSMETFCVIAKQKEHIVGVVFFYKINHAFLSQHIFSPKNGAYADNKEIFELMYKSILKATRHNAITKLSINSTQQFSGLSCILEKKIFFGIDLKQPKQALWKDLRSKTRNSIRKGQKYCLHITKDNKNIKLFYKIYNQRMKQKNVPISRYKYFKNLNNIFNNNCDVYIAFYKSKPIATLILLYGGKQAFYAYSAILNGYEKIRPIYSLLWAAIEHCYERDIEFLNLGESRKGSGTYEFKSLFGGTPIETYYYNTALGVPTMLEKIYSRLYHLRNLIVHYACKHILPECFSNKLVIRRNINERII